jgi:hypothetical protein
LNQLALCLATHRRDATSIQLDARAGARLSLRYASPLAGFHRSKPRALKSNESPDLKESNLLRDFHAAVHPMLLQRGRFSGDK